MKNTFRPKTGNFLTEIIQWVPSEIPDEMLKAWYEAWDHRRQKHNAVVRKNWVEKTHLLETMAAALAESALIQQKGETSSVLLTCDVWWQPEFSAVRWIPQSRGLSVFNLAVQMIVYPMCPSRLHLFNYCEEWASANLISFPVQFGDSVRVLQNNSTQQGYATVQCFPVTSVTCHSCTNFYSSNA